MEAKNEAISDPMKHGQAMQMRLSELIDHAKRDIERVSEPRFQALLETTSEVLGGLRTAFEHYEKGVEKAWHA